MAAILPPRETENITSKAFHAPPLSNMFAPAAPAKKRPRPRGPRLALLGLALCAVAYCSIFLCGNEGAPSRLLLRRRLAFLDLGAEDPPKRLPYGRDTFDQNYQSLVRPSVIHSDMFRQRAREGTAADAAAAGACDDVLLFLPHAFGHNGHASQLNNYLLAALIATFTDRAMVMLEPPPALNNFKSNSQFGCPPEAWETRVVRADGPPKRVGWNFDFPQGLDRLIKHPAWLSRQCPVPCDFAYEEWEEMSLANNATLVPVPREVRCRTRPKGGRRRDRKEGRATNVVVMGGQQVRDFFSSHYKHLMYDHSNNLQAEWALRLGARHHEARVFSALTDKYQIWDYASALLSRSGILRFQPWIARDVEEYIEGIDLPLDVRYDGIHVRRGDKLESDARFQVRRYWSERGLLDKTTGQGPRNYIPFAHYLSQFDDTEEGGGGECQEDSEPRLVYVATDDPVEVRREIMDLPKDSDGNTLLRTKNGCQMTFKFAFGHEQASAMDSYHLDGDISKGDCEDRYARNIAGVADLMILAKSRVFVGEFNSNWGRLVRTFRLRVNDSTKVENGARPVLTEGEMRVAWGQQHPGPPGW